MTNLTLDRLPTQETFSELNIGFNHDDIQSLIKSSSLHLNGKLVGEENEVLDTVQDLTKECEYSRDGFLSIFPLIYDKLKLFDAHDYHDACQFLIEWKHLAIHPDYETINELFSNKSSNFNLNAKSDLHDFIDFAFSVPIAKQYLPYIELDHSIVTNPFLSGSTQVLADPITYYGLNEYLKWLNKLVLAIDGNDILRETYLDFEANKKQTFTAYSQELVTESSLLTIVNSSYDQESIIKGLNSGVLHVVLNDSQSVIDKKSREVIAKISNHSRSFQKTFSKA